ncbi:hypothetical protein [Streptomyces luteireticuli]|uniref:hypothetical protein n=1 Tax=Streptomyces luteireticuli TaxID=173858 RepID=UPI003558D7AE
MRISFAAVTAALLGSTAIIPPSAAQERPSSPQASAITLTCQVNAEAVFKNNGTGVVNADYVGCLRAPGPQDVSAWTVTRGTAKLTCSVIPGKVNLHADATAVYTNRDTTTFQGMEKADVTVDTSTIPATVKETVSLSGGPYDGYVATIIVPTGIATVDPGPPSSCGISRVSIGSVQGAFTKS